MKLHQITLSVEFYGHKINTPLKNALINQTPKNALI